MVRNFDPLRCAGFRNVVGLVGDWPVAPASWPGNGLMMATPGSQFMAEVRADMHTRFNGSWGDNCESVTNVTFRRVAIRYEVLVMPQQAFFHYSWEARTSEQFLCEGAKLMDFTLSYAVHLYHTLIRFGNAEANDMYSNMTVAKLLVRDCNFCRLVRPHLLEVMQRGLIQESW